MNEKNAEFIYSKILKKVEKLIGTTFRTNTSQLHRIGKDILDSKFAGVFPIDKINQYTLSHSKPYAILNLDESHKKGTHWCAVYLNSDNQIILYDSFGRNKSKIIPSLLYMDIIQTDPDAEQNKEEENCGQRSIAWLILVELFGEDISMLI